MNAGASLSAVPSPIEGSGTAWVLLGSWALSPARPTPIPPRHECRGFSALLVKTCPALRPRWCPAHSPYRTQDYCLPALAHRRLTTTLPISGLNHAAYLLATPGFVRPLAGRHAGSLLTCWLDVRQVGLAQGAHPLGNNNPFHGVPSTPKVSGLPWREQAVVRLGVPRGLRVAAP